MAAIEESENFSANNAMVLTHPLHANILLKSLNESRTNPELCDGTIVINNTEIPVQKNVLAAASPYFRAQYSYERTSSTGGALSHSSSKSRLDIGHLNSIVFNQILDYIYTSHIALSEDNIQDVLQAADILLMLDLKQLCCDYLENCISVSNCLGIRDFSEQYNCQRVHHAATIFLDEQFREISFSDEFLELEPEKLISLLQRDTLQVQGEAAILDCILRWVRHKEQVRRGRLKEILLKAVRCHLLNTTYLQQNILEDELIRKCELENLILELRLNHQGDLNQRGYSEAVVCVGGEGEDDQGSGISEIKNLVRCVVPPPATTEARRVQWLDLAPLLTARAGHGLVEAGGCLYAIGGRDNNGRILNTGERYDPTRDEWTSIPPMNHARVGFGLINIDDRIYAIGGSNDMSDPLTSVEEFDIYANKWRRLPSMNVKKAWAAYAVQHKKIYVIGGGVMGKLYESVECFDPNSESWYSVAPMKERRFDARAVGTNDNVYVFGGLRRFECPSAVQGGGTGMKFCSTEVYCKDVKQWRSLARNGHGMCIMAETSHLDNALFHKDNIYIMGDLDLGTAPNVRYNFIRSYSLATNQWRGVVCNHPPNQRSSTQSCFLRLSNSMLYKLLWSQNKLKFDDLK